MPAIHINSISVSEGNVQTSLLLSGKPIRVLDGETYISADEILSLEQVVTSLLVSLDERELVLDGTAVPVSTLPPIYSTRPVGYDDFKSMILASRSRAVNDEHVGFDVEALSQLMEQARQAVVDGSASLVFESEEEEPEEARPSPLEAARVRFSQFRKS